MKRKLQLVAVAIGAILSGFLAVAVYHAIHPQSEGAVGLTAAQARQEYKLAERGWPLAPGATYKAVRDVPGTMLGKPQYYEAGAAANSANETWFCSWVRYSVQHSTASSNSLKELQHYRKTRLYAHGSDQNTKNLMTAVYQSVASGQGSTASSFLQRNCPS
jgi:hypothetical protein